MDANAEVAHVLSSTVQESPSFEPSSVHFVGSRAGASLAVCQSHDATAVGELKAITRSPRLKSSHLWPVLAQPEQPLGSSEVRPLHACSGSSPPGLRPPGLVQTSPLILSVATLCHRWQVVAKHALGTHKCSPLASNREISASWIELAPLQLRRPVLSSAGSRLNL